VRVDWAAWIILTRAKARSLQDKSVLAGLKTRFPGLKSGAGTPSLADIDSFLNLGQRALVDFKCAGGHGSCCEVSPP
jgi:hypothetical protein